MNERDVFVVGVVLICLGVLLVDGGEQDVPGFAAEGTHQAKGIGSGIAQFLSGECSYTLLVLFIIGN